MLAGVDCGVDTIVPTLLTGIKEMDYSYRRLNQEPLSVNNIAPKNNEQKIKSCFNTDIKLLGNELLLKLDDETRNLKILLELTLNQLKTEPCPNAVF